jgi:uncharacterized repeat protein (TIGR01451 family)
MKAMKNTSKKTIPRMTALLLGIGFVLGGFAWADAAKDQSQNSDLAISLTARKVVPQTDGQEKLLPADRAFPGEVIQYDALYLNRSREPLSNVSPVLPIPNGMVFVPDSAKPAPAEASLDGRSFQAIPIKRKITTPTGEEKEEEVPSTEYRALRWHLGDMASGARMTVTARTKLIPAGR